MANKSDRLWYPRYPGDYARKTAHLTLVQHGVYTLLLDWYYSNSRPIPNDTHQIFRICVAVEKHEQLAARYILDEFFRLESDGWHNDRADAEIVKKTEISEKRRYAQAVGEQKKLQNRGQNTSQIAHKNDAFVLTSTATPITIPRTSEKDVVRQTKTAFEEIWSFYPGRGKDGQVGAAFKGDKKTALKKFETIFRGTQEVDREALIRNIIKSCREYSQFLERSGHPSKHLSTWLNAAGWETDYSVSAPSQANSRRGSSYSLEAVHAQAMADQTYRYLREGGSPESPDVGADPCDL